MANGGPPQRAGRSRRSSEVESTDPELLRSRLVDQYAHHYHLIVSIFKGVSLFAGATAVHSIFSNGATLNVKLNAAALWAGSFVTMLVTYDAIMVTTMIIVRRPNLIDVVGPFLLGLCEFLQFAVLTLPGDSRTAATEQLSQIAWWPLLFALSTAVGCVNTVNYERRLPGLMGDAAPRLAEAYRRFHQNARRDVVATAVPTVVVLSVFLVLRWGPEDLREWQGVVGLIAAVGSSGALRNYELARRALWDAFPPSAAADARPATSEPSV